MTWGRGMELASLFQITKFKSFFNIISSPATLTPSSIWAKCPASVIQPGSFRVWHNATSLFMPGHKHLLELCMKQNCVTNMFVTELCCWREHLLHLSTAQLCHTPFRPIDPQFLCQVRKGVCYTWSTSVHAIRANLWLLQLDVTGAVTFEPHSHALAERLHCPVKSRIWCTG